MTRRDLKSRFAGSSLGLFWAIIVPLLSSAVYLLVFSMFMRGQVGGRYSDINFVSFYFVGFAPWLLFADSVNRSLGVIRQNASLVTKISFPNQVLPVAVFFSGLVTHLVLLCICFILMVVFGYGISFNIFLVLYYFVMLFLFTLGISLTLSAVSVFFSDLVEIIPILVSLYFFCTPVLYDQTMVASNMPHSLYLLMVEYNPMHLIIDGFRKAFFAKEFLPVSMKEILLLTSYSLVSFGIGSWVFKSLKKSFSDVL